jgi:hypothetical protein
VNLAKSDEFCRNGKVRGIFKIELVVVVLGEKLGVFGGNLAK